MDDLGGKPTIFGNKHILLKERPWSQALNFWAYFQKNIEKNPAEWKTRMMFAANSKRLGLRFVQYCLLVMLLLMELWARKGPQPNLHTSRASPWYKNHIKKTWMKLSLSFVDFLLQQKNAWKRWGSTKIPCNTTFDGRLGVWILRQPFRKHGSVCMVKIGWVISSKLLMSKNVWDVKMKEYISIPLRNPFQFGDSRNPNHRAPNHQFPIKTVDCMTFEKKTYNILDPFPHKYHQFTILVEISCLPKKNPNNPWDWHTISQLDTTFPYMKTIKINQLNVGKCTIYTWILWVKSSPHLPWIVSAGWFLSGSWPRWFMGKVGPKLGLLCLK